MATVLVLNVQPSFAENSDLFGKLDANQELISFCSTLEKVCIETVEGGKMTKDLALLIHGKKLDKTHYLTTQKFLSELKRNLEQKISDK